MWSCRRGARRGDRFLYEHWRVTEELDDFAVFIQIYTHASRDATSLKHVRSVIFLSNIKLNSAYLTHRFRNDRDR